MDARGFLKGMLYTRAEVDEWFAGNAFPMSKYDSGLGYVHRDRRRKFGVDESVAVYSYDLHGARRTVTHADGKCRINTYGDSFTDCDQVNDCESWQEVLAAHICEPVRNFGVGGYSVYQSYLRLKREEVRNPAEYIVFNIFEDDHFRNLSSWQNINSGKNAHNITPTRPFVNVNPDTGALIERDNPCPTRDSVYNLCDFDWVCANFEHDFGLEMRMAYLRYQQEKPGAGFLDFVSEHDRYLSAALTASMRIVEKVEQFAVAQNRSVIYVLSYGAEAITKAIDDGWRFDQQFVDFMRSKDLPVIDLMQAHEADYSRFNISLAEYLRRYFIGHYNPLGNFFTALALKDKLVEVLEPKPLPYQGVP